MKTRNNESLNPVIPGGILRKLQIRDLVILFIKVCLLSTLGLALLRYVFSIRMHIISNSDENWELVFPCLLPWYVAWMWLWPKIKKLPVKSPNMSRRIMLLLLVVATLGGMFYFSSYYLVRATGKLVVADTVEALEKMPPGKYYKLTKPYFIHPYSVHMLDRPSLFKDSTFVTYVVAPVSTSQYTTRYAKYWLTGVFESPGHKGLKNISSVFQSHMLNVQRTMMSYNPSEITYFENISSTDDVQQYKKAVLENAEYNRGTEVVLLKAHLEPFEDRTKQSLWLTFFVFLIGTVALFTFLTLHTRK